MLKIAVLGGRTTVLGFKAIGLDTFPVSDADEAKTVLHQLAKQGSDYAIIYVEENYAASMLPEIDKYKDSMIPAIILIPGSGNSLGIGQSALQAAVERAVGADIL